MVLEGNKFIVISLVVAHAKLVNNFINNHESRWKVMDKRSLNSRTIAKFSVFLWVENMSKYLHPLSPISQQKLFFSSNKKRGISSPPPHPDL